MPCVEELHQHQNHHLGYLKHLYLHRSVPVRLLGAINVDVQHRVRVPSSPVHSVHLVLQPLHRRLC